MGGAVGAQGRMICSAYPMGESFVGQPEQESVPFRRADVPNGKG